MVRGGSAAVVNVMQTMQTRLIRRRTSDGCEMKPYCLLLSFAFLMISYSYADEAIVHQESQTNDIKSATVIYVPKAKIKVRPKVERAKNKIRAKVDRGKDKVERKTKSIKPKTKEKIRRKLFVPQASTN